MSALARALFAECVGQYATLQARIGKAEAQLNDSHKSNEVERRLTAVPRIGTAIASLLVTKTPEPKAFRSGRDFAA